MIEQFAPYAAAAVATILCSGVILGIIGMAGDLDRVERVGFAVLLVGAVLLVVGVIVGVWWAVLHG